MMKIKTLEYKLVGEGKNSRLVASLNIDGCIDFTQTEAIIGLYPIGYFWGKVSNVLTDWLCISAIVYSIDRDFDRHKYSCDGWSRDFVVTFKVICPEIFNNLSGQIESMLAFLTGDYWKCRFVENKAMPEIKFRETKLFDGITQVNLFSGGLDSLIGFVDYISTNPKGKLFLASHYDHFMTGPKSDQQKILKNIPAEYQNRYLSIGAIHITPKHSKELTCRSRSLMFLAIALLVAAYTGTSIVVPENGPVSLNYPLSPSRRAACSTRTTHPIFLSKFTAILKEQGITISITNPYEFKTKGEMVKDCSNKELLMKLAFISNSCGKRSQHQFMLDDPHATHCGRCMPCMYRKASLLGFDDKTTYGITLPTLFSLKDKDMSNDFYAMLNYLKRNLTEEEIIKELHIAGLTKLPHFYEYVELVKRTRSELKQLILQEGSDDILKYVGLQI